VLTVEVRLARKLLHHGLSEPRLADARFARDQNDLPLAALDQVVARQQQFQF